MPYTATQEEEEENNWWQYSFLSNRSCLLPIFELFPNRLRLVLSISSSSSSSLSMHRRRETTEDVVVCHRLKKRTCHERWKTKEAGVKKRVNYMDEYLPVLPKSYAGNDVHTRIHTNKEGEVDEVRSASRLNVEYAFFVLLPSRTLPKNNFSLGH